MNDSDRSVTGSRKILFAVLLSLASLAQGGCATYGVLSWPEVNSEYDGFHATKVERSENYRCLTFDLEGEGDAEDSSHVVLFDQPEVVRHIETLSQNTDAFSLDVDTFLRREDSGESILIKLSATAMPLERQELSTHRVYYRDENRPLLEAKYTGLVRAVSQAVLGDNAGQIWYEELAWVDGKGNVVEEANALERLDCRQADQLGVNLLLQFVTAKQYMVVAVPARVVCDYNCNQLRQCDAINELPLDNDNSLKLSLSFPYGQRKVDEEEIGQACGEAWQAMPQNFSASVRERWNHRDNVNELHVALSFIATPVTLAWDIATYPIQLAMMVSCINSIGTGSSSDLCGMVLMK